MKCSLEENEKEQKEKEIAELKAIIL